jgi:asparagine synthase (glutamine-hydrolysing)
MKVLKDLCRWIKPFPPGYVFEDGRLQSYHSYASVKPESKMDLEKALSGIETKFLHAVEKRLESDVPLGFLLSGGLDSSLVCGIAAKILDKPLKTFSIGIQGDPIDTKYARQVAEYIKSDHTEILFSKEDIFDTLEELIFLLETWDITTIRAAMGMYLLTKYIREKTDVRVVLTGEVSDEIFGYKYTDFAPSGEAFQKEAEKRVRELYLYDVLRADRCIAGASLEARVPFSDQDFVDFVMSIPGKMKLNTYGPGKYLLRKAFEGKGYVPESILWREKAAFSDAVGHSMVDFLKEHAEKMYTDKGLEKKSKKYKHGTPFTKESLMYREIFEKHFPKQSEIIPDFWMPNKTWKGCAVDDPSARVLSNYGTSGT